VISKNCVSFDSFPALGFELFLVNLYRTVLTTCVYAGLSHDPTAATPKTIRFYVISTLCEEEEDHVER